MADVIVVREDFMGRPRGVTRYPEGEPLPSWLEDRLPARETQVQDSRQETKEAVYVGGPWYRLEGGERDGEKVRGKGKVPDDYTIK